ncbi:hypothetical protein Cpap_0871 [Ruminiclostridium papyrosolvens DSM 2782]|uniref:37kDa nucleoid-associated protein n=1 Tax=Ruminiclostridium papyrosolvens DSM 2782 TaxID=588581 RepID=F1TH19_9FIRM|nr:nucleoid-associated protein [Ruminiclostridium papyrosolvens]EGD46259.1 hypothetical protein Cpap_0871 [Ruminiclostridium papyrosolvens DSM 2782]WES33019.1 nucleoid-associated protein [Ruminiclostridium papyrosolvens DSM 2782]
MSTIVLFKDAYLIDYTSHSILRKPITDEFNDYVTELVNEISKNVNLQYFQIRDMSTQVISRVLDSIDRVIANNGLEMILENIKTIANRLLEKEIHKQEQISQMGRNIKKGSLLQAIIKRDDEETGEYEYLYMLTKVEHNAYIDEESFNLKRGFQVEKVSLWKSCLIHVVQDTSKNLQIGDIKVFLDNPATYWHNDFLEVDPIRKDEFNTKTLFRSVEHVLRKKIFSQSNHDYFMLRNNLIGYMRRTPYIDYGILVDTVFKSYPCEEITEDVKNTLITTLEKLPDSNKFDRQFNCVNTAIGAKIIKKSFNLTDDIELIIKNALNNAENIITAGDESGRRYVKIYTNDDETYRTFKSRH